MDVASLAARLGLKVDKGAWAEGTKRIGAMQVALGTLIASGIRKAVDSFRDLTLGMTEYGDKLGDASRKTGVSAHFLEELAFSAGGTREHLDSVTGAATTMSLQLHDALTNRSGNAAKALKQLGISLDDPRVKMGDVEGIMRVMADRFETMSDGSEKNAISMALMGKQGTEMSQVLSELREKTETFQKVGGWTREEDLDALNKAKDFIEAISQGWHTIKVRVAAFALPRIEQAIKGVSAWYEEHKDTIQRVYEVVKTTIVTVVTELYKRWTEVFQTVKAFVLDNKDSLLTFFKAVGTVAYVAFRVALEVVKALITALGVVAVAVGVVADAFVGVGKWLGETTAKAVLFFGKLGEVGTAIGDMFIAVGEGVEKVWKRIIGWIEDKLEVVKALITALGVVAVAVGVVADAFVSVGKWLGETTAKAVLFFGKLGEVGTAIGDMFTAVGEGVEKVWKRIIGWIEDKVGWVTDKVEWVADKLGLGGSDIAPQDAFLQGFRSTQTPASALLAGFASTARPAQVANGNQTINGAPVTVNVTPGPGMDPMALAQLVAAKTKEVIDMQLRTAQETLVEVGG